MLVLTRSQQFRLIHYDPRGCGLSELKAAEISFDGFVRDLEPVVDRCGLERFCRQVCSY
jgi:pimeloyl-ACP methyl ester carboxylesterase